MKHIRTIIAKEWMEVFKNKMVLFTIGAHADLVHCDSVNHGENHVRRGTRTAPMADVPAMFAQVCGQMNAGDCMQIYLINQFLVLYMMMPLIIPITIAAYSSSVKRPPAAWNRCWLPP